MLGRFLLLLFVACCLLSWKSLACGKSLNEMTREELRTMPLDLTDHDTLQRYVRKVGLADVVDAATEKEKEDDEEDGDDEEDSDDDSNDDDDSGNDEDGGEDDDLAIAAMEQVEEATKEALDIAEKASEDDGLPDELEIEVNPGQGEVDGDDLQLPPIDVKISVEGRENDGGAGGGGSDTSPFASAFGLGGAIMNGCFGTGYGPGDPCFDVSETIDRCLGLMEACTYIGIGFDGRGVFGPESRKGNVLDYTCNDKKFFMLPDETQVDVPDMISIEGIYETTANSYTYESSEDYRNSLEMEAGLSASYGGFEGSMKAAYGQEKKGSNEAYLSVMEIDIIRYEAYMDKFEVSMLEVLFVSEFMDLPTNYFQEGAARQFQEFILRWGTHFVRSADFGGKLEIRNTMKKSFVSSVQDFDVQVQASYKSFFAVSGHFGIKGSFESSSASNEMSVSIQVEGGSALIAEAIADGGSTDIRGDLHDWLESIKDSPKPFNFRLSKITDILRFTSADLFPRPAPDNYNWGCESKSLYTDSAGTKYYWLQVEVKDPVTNATVLNKEKRYCKTTTRDEVTESIRERRESLDRAITVYLLEGPTSYGEFSFKGQEDCYMEFINADAVEVPAWDTLRHSEFRLRLGLPHEVKSRTVDLKPTEEFSAQYMHKLQQWLYGDIHTKKINHSMDSFTSEKMIDKMIINIGGLYMTFNETEGSFSMDGEDFKRSLGLFPDIVGEDWIDRPLAFAEAETPFHSFPCSDEFTSEQRVGYETGKSSCLEFLAASTGPMYVIFAANPERKSSWYTTLITAGGVAFYKGDQLVKRQVDPYLSGLGSETLLQSYLVCGSVIEVDGKDAFTVEYGKAPRAEDNATIYMVMVDLESEGIPSFYGFGAGNKDAVISRTRRVSLDHGELECGPYLEKDATIKMCIDILCHDECVPLPGCSRARDGIPKPSECAACKNLIDYKFGEKTCVSECRNDDWFVQDGICILKCGDNYLEMNEECVCRLTDNGECVTDCPGWKARKITEVGGIYTCECILVGDGDTCLEKCPVPTVKMPTYPGFFKCEEFKAGGAEVLTGKYAIGGVLQDGVRTFKDCLELCKNETRIADYDSCGGIEYDSSEGGKCYLHSFKTVCGSTLDDEEKTLVRRAICNPLPGYTSIVNTFYYPTDQTVAATESSVPECARLCDSKTGCWAFNFAMNGAICYLLTATSNSPTCDMKEKAAIYWSHARKNCKIPDTHSCLYTTRGAEYKGGHRMNVKGLYCKDEPCKNKGSEEKKPWCYHPGVNEWDFCDIPMCSPFGTKVIKGTCDGSIEVETVYDKTAELRECAILCMVDETCKHFEWYSWDYGASATKCHLYSNPLCTTAKKWDYGYSYSKPEA